MSIISSRCAAVLIGRKYESSPYVSFYAPRLVPAGTAEARISYGNSVRLSVCLSGVSQPGAIPSPGEIETPGLHHMRIITSTADELSGGTNIDDLERP